MGTSTLDRGLAFGLKLPVYRKEAIFERLMALWDAVGDVLGLGVRGMLDRVPPSGLLRHAGSPPCFLPRAWAVFHIFMKGDKQGEALAD
jgi:hypothetical protein